MLCFGEQLTQDKNVMRSGALHQKHSAKLPEDADIRSEICPDFSWRSSCTYRHLQPLPEKHRAA